MADDNPEEWRPVPGHPDYKVSSLGRVMSLKRKVPRLLSTGPDPAGYRRTHLDGTHWYVHRIVARTFIGPCPPDMEVGHRNHVRHDNRAVNLHYVTRQQNLADRQWSARTHCRSGHPLAGDNLYIVPSTKQLVCKACRRKRMKRNARQCPYCSQSIERVSQSGPKETV